MDTSAKADRLRAAIDYLHARQVRSAGRSPARCPTCHGPRSAEQWREDWCCTDCQAYRERMPTDDGWGDLSGTAPTLSDCLEE